VALRLADNLRTAIAGVIASRVDRPRLLVVQAWLWLAANHRDLEGKRRCLDAVLQLEPENETASLALLVLDQRRPMN